MRLPLIIVIPAADVTQENAWMKENIDPQGGQYTFTSSLSDDGVNVTHYWCSRQWKPDEAAIISDRYTTYTENPAAVLADLGLESIASSGDTFTSFDDGFSEGFN